MEIITALETITQSAITWSQMAPIVGYGLLGLAALTSLVLSQR